MSDIPSRELNDLYENCNKIEFSEAIVGNNIDDGKNIELRKITSFSREYKCIIFDDGIFPKSLKLSEEFLVVNQNNQLLKLWLRNRPLSSKRRIFMRRLGLYPDKSQLNKITTTPLSGRGARSPQSVDFKEIEGSIEAYFDHFLTRGTIKVGSHTTIKSYSIFPMNAFFSTNEQQRILYLMNKRLDSKGNFKDKFVNSRRKF